MSIIEISILVLAIVVVVFLLKKKTRPQNLDANNDGTVDEKDGEILSHNKPKDPDPRVQEIIDEVNRTRI